MTTSANIAGTPRPFLMVARGNQATPYGSRVFKVDEIKPCDKKKKASCYAQVGMIQIGEAYTSPVGDPKDGFWKINSLGKIGTWRTIKGNRYFFPSDGSGPIPKIRGVKEKPKAAPEKGEEPKKKGILGRIMDKVTGALGGGGGAKASLKDVKAPETKKGSGGESGGESGGGGPKKKGESKIPDADKTLNQVETMMLKASRSKGGGKVAGALKQMQKALKSDDPKAFKAAEQSLAMATAKLAKKKGR